MGLLEGLDISCDWLHDLEGWGGDEHRVGVGLLEGRARFSLGCLCSLGKQLWADTGPLVGLPESQEPIG